MALFGQTNGPKSSLPYGGRWSRGKRWWNRNKHLVFACLTLSTLLAGAGGVTWWAQPPSLQRVASTPLEKRAQIAAPEALAPRQTAPQKAEKPVPQALPLEAQSDSVTVTGPIGQGDAATEEDRVGLPAPKAVSSVPQAVAPDLSGLQLAQTASAPETLKQLPAQASPLVPLVLKRAKDLPSSPLIPLVLARAATPLQAELVVASTPVRPETTNLPVVEVVVTPKVQARKVATVSRPRLPPAPTTAEGLPDIPAILRMPKTYWDVVGNDPFERDLKIARSRPVRERAFKELGLSGACLERALDITNRAGVRGTIRNGDEFVDSESGSGPHMNQEVTFAQDGSEDWTLTCSTTTLLVRLADGCNNWGLALPPPTLALVPPAPVIPPPKVAELPPPILVAPPPPVVALPVNDCYLIPFDYSHQEGVAWDEKHRVRVSAHIDATEDELEEVYNDKCFGVTDETGFNKPFHRCEFCLSGVYPPEKLAVAVGLPEKEPDGSLSFRLVNGKGYLSLPKAWAVRRVIPCVITERYRVTIDGFTRYQAVSRFDIVEPSEIRATLDKGQLGRTLMGEKKF